VSLATDQARDAADVAARAGIELDAECAAAVELARAAAGEIAQSEAAANESGTVGAHLGVRAEGERLVTHAFEATLRGYRGWYWAVTVGRAPGFEPTIAEIVLLPGEGALRAPAWVPWAERVQQGDLSPGDVHPTPVDDPRLVPSYVLSDDPQVAEVAFELGMGRPRVLSREGRLDAADRWFAGDGGPDTPMAKQAPGLCGTCGFYLPLAGSMKAAFGACANEISPSDGRVVTVDHGCGAHSEALPELHAEELGEVFDDEQLEIVGHQSASAEFAGEPSPDLGEHLVVNGEGASIETVDRDDATAVETEHQPSGEQVADQDGPQPDDPAAIAGPVEQPSPGDAGQDLIAEHGSAQDALDADHRDVAAAGLMHDGSVTDEER
jgi:hypothetical protein